MNKVKSKRRAANPQKKSAYRKSGPTPRSISPLAATANTSAGSRDGGPASSDHTPHVVYLVEWDDGLCRLHTFPQEEIQRAGGIAGIEATLSNKYKWHEKLGYVPVSEYGMFADDLHRLVLHSTRRLVRTEDIFELAYLPVEWGPKN